jgi:nucleotide-binding universal stress UspA family protein
MPRVLAAIDNSAASRPVLEMAVAFAPLLRATVEAVHVTEDGARTALASAERLHLPLRLIDGDPLEAILKLAAADDVVAIAVGARGRPRRQSRTGHVAGALADRTDTPVLVVPPETQAPSGVHNVLLAMEGTPTMRRSAKRAIELASGAGLKLTVIHVTDEASIPAFTDEIQHETEAYAKEFLARYDGGALPDQMEFRTGVPVEEIVAAVDSMAPEILVVGWPQSQDRDRGVVAHELLERIRIPLLLIATS